MATLTDIDVAEVLSLRQEITTRIGLENGIIALELAAVGTGLTVLNESPHVLAGLAAISSFLWLLWMDQSLSTYKIAAYLAIEMAPRLRELTGSSVLGWETFLRRVETGGEQSARALYPHTRAPTRGIVRAVRVDWYAPLLFGVTPPLLLSLYLRVVLRGKADRLIVTLVCLFVISMWLFVISRFIDFVHNSRIIDKAIASAPTTTSTQPRRIRGPRRAWAAMLTRSGPAAPTAHGAASPRNGLPRKRTLLRSPGPPDRTVPPTTPP